MSNARKKHADDANARAQVYRLLATVFRAEPPTSLIDELKSPQFSEVFASMGHPLGDEFAATSSVQLSENLAIEYTKIFIGPGSHISPHESIFLKIDGKEGELWGEKTVEVKKFIESAGFTYEPRFAGLPDHVSAELEFMQKLAETEAQLLSKGEIERADWCLKVQKKFIDEHLILWVPELCDAVIARAESSFYRQMADVAKAFLAYDAEAINEQLAEAA